MNYTGTQKSMTVLQDAQTLIHGDRADLYGPAIENFTRIAYRWTGHLYTKLRPSITIHPADVCIMMSDVKNSRLSYAVETDQLFYARDSVVDNCGYMALIEKMGYLEEKSGA